MDSNTRKHALVGQISFRQLSWIEHGDCISFVHKQDSCKVGSLLKPLVFGSWSTVDSIDLELKLTIPHIEHDSNSGAICDWYLVQVDILFRLSKPANISIDTIQLEPVSVVKTIFFEVATRLLDSNANTF